MKTDAKLTENPAENGNKSKPLLPVVFFSLYLPYSPRVKTNNIIRTLVPELPFDVNEINNYVAMNTVCTGIGHKLILKPLSYLTKDENFDLYMDLCEEIGVVRCEHLLLALQDNLKYAFNLQYLNALEEFMNKNHFDWKYNLIEKGLAISIDDVE